MNDLVPEEAIAAAAVALESQEVDAGGPRAWFRAHAEGAIRAAAPLIVAAELERLADTLPMGRDEWSADYQAGRYDARQFFLSRASVLRGEGDPK